MQGYFCYKLEGSKEELEQSLELIEKVANKEIEYGYLYPSLAKDLFDFRSTIEKNISYNLQTTENKEKNKNTHILKFDMIRSGKVSYLTFDFDTMPHILSNTFIDLRVSGEGYALDYLPKTSFISERGTNKYKIDLIPNYMYISED